LVVLVWISYDDKIVAATAEIKQLDERLIDLASFGNSFLLPFFGVFSLLPF
jgi:hypothetical protein